MEIFALAAWVLHSISNIPEGHTVVRDAGTVQRLYEDADYRPHLKLLRQRYGKNKVIPTQYELEILLALAHYPQLENTKIQFVVTQKGAPISSWPVLHTLFCKKSKRLYRISISENPRWRNSPALVRNMAFNSRVGAIGHELAHTVFFEQKNFWQMVGLGFSFISPKFHRQFERNTDVRAIEHRLGWQLFDWSWNIRGGRYLDDPKSWLDRYYLSPEKIEALMREQKSYRRFFSEK